MGGGEFVMKDFEREELLIRMDERVKTIFNRMQDFDRMFTNHLSHHEQWENDIRTQMRWWVAVALTAATGSGAMMMGVI
jgi:alkylhydroperoxidase/carboxymuconolactone decarboxylase family protein YurZ